MFDSINSTFLNQAKLLKFLRYLSLFLVISGTAIRLIQYFNNRSLWFDEVNLALNMVNRSYGELTQTLDHNQAAPLGFLWVEKLATQIFGNNEYALRLFPLVSNLVAFGVFYRLVYRYASPLAAPMAIALFAFGRYTLYFATELKQYSSDIAIALILFWFLTKIAHKILNSKEIIGYALLGSLVIWFSHPSIFMLAGIEGYYFLTAASKDRFKILFNRLLVYLAWLTSFGLFYFLTIAKTMNNEDLASSWSSRYPATFWDIEWLFDALGRFFYNPMGFTGITDGIGIFAFIFGCVAWYSKNRTFLGALIAPFVATLAAAYLHQYPFRERLVVFLVPLGIIIIAEGIAWLLSKFQTGDKSRPREYAACKAASRSIPLRLTATRGLLSFPPTKVIKNNRFKTSLLAGLLGAFCFVALTIPPIIRASSFIIHPELKHEIRPVAEYVLSHKQPEDRIYVYSLGAQAFTYYAARLGYSEQDYILGLGNLSYKDKEATQNWQELRTDIEPLRGKSRVWFVLRAEESEEAAILEYLNKIGQEIDVFKQPGASAHLYDISKVSR